MSLKKKVIVTQQVSKNRQVELCLKYPQLTLHFIPLIQTYELSLSSSEQQILESINQYDWLIFLSKTSVEIFLSKNITIQRNISIAAVGNETKNKLGSLGFSSVFVASKPSGSKALAEELCQRQAFRSSRVLVFQSRNGRRELNEELKKMMVHFDTIDLYETRIHPNAKDILSELSTEDLSVTFSSPSAIESFLSLVGSPVPNIYASIRYVTIGETSAVYAKERGLKIRQSQSASLESMLDGLIDGL